MDIKPLLIFCALILNSEELYLKQVVILSRHNVRTPLSKTLSQTSPKPWPKWNEKPGYLTPKGTLLEGYMGEYFYSWLNQENLLTQECPSENEFYVYANTAQRTLASAKSFADNAFPRCNITIHHANQVDPIFNPVIHNTSSIFVQEALEIMENHMKNLHLNHSYDALEQILDYTHSEKCIEDHCCNLATDKNTASVKTGTKPNINGPLQICKSAIDSFIMEYYEAFDMKNVAWGLLNTNKQWESILDISHSYHNIIFNTTLLAKDISEPLLKYMTDIFLDENKPTITLLMGHDANLYTVLNAMDFKPYSLKEQHEITPVGGKIVFQKWSDNNTNDYLKIDYVYQPSEQMRNGVKLSLENPPIFETLELKYCKVIDNGLCLWKDFKNLLMHL